jgi:hypothetical protein
LAGLLEVEIRRRDPGHERDIFDAFLFDQRSSVQLSVGEFTELCFGLGRGPGLRVEIVRNDALPVSSSFSNCIPAIHRWRIALISCAAKISRRDLLRASFKRNDVGQDRCSEVLQLLIRPEMENGNFVVRIWQRPGLAFDRTFSKDAVRRRADFSFFRDVLFYPIGIVEI